MKAETAAKYNQRIPRYTSYPTAPHFNAAVGDVVYRAWLRALPAAARASVYLHVPFCASLCWYCGCHTTVVRSHQPASGSWSITCTGWLLPSSHCRAPSGPRCTW